MDKVNSLINTLRFVSDAFVGSFDETSKDFYLKMVKQFEPY